LKNPTKPQFWAPTMTSPPAMRSSFFTVFLILSIILGPALGRPQFDHKENLMYRKEKLKRCFLRRQTTRGNVSERKTSY
jgi:hypothetical protein